MENIVKKTDSGHRVMTWIVAAMTLRSTAWMVISVLVYRQLMRGYRGK